MRWVKKKVGKLVEINRKRRVKIVSVKSHRKENKQENLLKFIISTPKKNRGFEYTDSSGDGDWGVGRVVLP